MTDVAPAAPAAPETGTAPPAAAGTPPAATPPPGQPASATEPKIENPQAVLDALAKANDEAAKLRLKLKEHEDAKLTEAERGAQQLQEAQDRAAKAEAAADRAQVAAAKGVPVNLLPETGDKAAMEAAADALIAFKGEQTGPRPPTPNPAQGGQPAAASSGQTPDEWLRAQARR